MNKKKLLALLMALVMTFSLVPVTALAETEPEPATATVGTPIEDITNNKVTFDFEVPDDGKYYNLEVEVDKPISNLTFAIQSFTTPITGVSYTNDSLTKYLIGDIVPALAVANTSFGTSSGLTASEIIALLKNQPCIVNYSGATETGVTMTVQIVSKASATGAWEDVGEPVTCVLNPVAKIGDKGYASLEAAFAAAKDDDYIEVLADCSGNGIKVPQGKFDTNGLTVDFDGHTYTVDGTTVGSTGTETNGFQLLKDNKITFMNGTITSAKAKILVQNYSNLTLDGMTLTLNNSSYSSAYTLSNNNGNVVIDGTTINANPAGGFAFDVCRYASYTSVSVTVQGYSTINGNIQIDASNGDPKDGFTLELYDGTLNGEIVLTENAKTAMAENPGMISKLYGYDVAVSEGCYWADGDTLKYGGTAVAVIEHFDEENWSFEYTTYGTLQAAFDAAVDGDTITLLGDLTQDDGVKFDHEGISAKLNLNGKTFTVNTGSSVNNRAIKILNGTLEVYDGTIVAVGSGTTSSDGKGCYGAFRVEANGVLNAHDLTLTNARPWGLNVKVCGGEATLTNVSIESRYGGGIEVTEADLGQQSKSGTATLTGCTFTQTGYYDHCSTCLSVSGGSKLIIDGGSYTGDNYALYVFSSGGEIEVKDGTFSGNKDGVAIIAAIDENSYPGYAGGLKISGGNFSGGYSITLPAYMTITGGVFDHDPTDYVASGYTAVENTPETGKWTVKPAVTVKDDKDVAVDVANSDSKAAVSEDVTNETITEAITDTNTTVNGVQLTTTNTVNETTSGLQAVIDAAKSGENTLNNGTEASDAIENASSIEVKVNVAVTLTGYNSTSSQETATFSLTPTATVTTKDENGTPTATVPDVPVTNEMIDQTQDITVTLYTGFQPVQLIHKNGNTILEYFNEGDFVYANGVVTLTIHHFSDLVASATKSSESPYHFSNLTVDEAGIPAAPTVAVAKEETLFCGWYVDADYTNPIAPNAPITDAYAMFIDPSTLTVAIQVRQETIGTVEGASDIRLITTVPDTKYFDKVGFRLTLPSHENFKVSDHAFNTPLYDAIRASGSVVSLGDFVGHVGITGGASKKLALQTVTGVPDRYFSDNNTYRFKVVPYLITRDGRTVEGTAKYFKGLTNGTVRTFTPSDTLEGLD